MVKPEGLRGVKILCACPDISNLAPNVGKTVIDPPKSDSEPEESVGDQGQPGADQKPSTGLLWAIPGSLLWAGYNKKYGWIEDPPILRFDTNMFH